MRSAFHGLQSALLPFLTLALSGCVGLFANGSGSVSLGSHAKGALLRPVAFPFEGHGYQVHPDWRARDRRYTTDQVAFWLADVFRQASHAVPDTVAYLGDLSSRRGGESTMHRSHASGRDVDVFLFACREDGRPVRELPAMLHFSDDGRAQRWSPSRPGLRITAPVPAVRFDARRTWALVRAMLSSPGAQVQWVFLNQSLAGLVMAEAERHGEDPALLLRALSVIRQPTDSQPHDDHMHVRLFCDPSDRRFGCSDKGPKRWLKKHWKYLRPGQPRS